jgi:phosphoribosylaminoimidazole synthetase
VSLEPGSNAYQAAGVSIDAGNRAVELMREAVRATYSERVLAGIGSFGGVYDATALAGMAAPALVASTDGVGTKTKIAAALGRYDTIGYDIVNHSINDILVQGALPLFFMDYIATAKVDPVMIATVVGGCAAACRQAGCVLIGGETAEMPGVYQSGEFDLVGSIVGVVERSEMLPRANVAAGDVLLGLPSSGPHTNGYSLIRRIFAGTNLETRYPDVGLLGEALLAPHRSYLEPVGRLRRLVEVKALAHLTGGGFIENIPRVLPAGVAARIDLGAWRTPALFELIQRQGQVALAEMYRVFNMGIGMVVVVPAEAADAALRSGVDGWRIGELVAGEREVILNAG